MKRLILLFGLMAWLLAGCYDDKGNYDYKDINKVEDLSFMPKPIVVEEGVTYKYEYRMPSQEDLRVTYKPVFSQTMAENEENLSYLWVVAQDGKDKVDSVFTKELELVYPLRKTVRYSVKFRLTDAMAGLDYYSDFTMRTNAPFVNAWIVLNGPEHNRKLSAVEEPDSTNPIVTYDIYQDFLGRERFKDAEALAYVSMLNYWNRNMPENLYVMQRDSVALIYPFALENRQPSQTLFAPGKSPRNLAYSESHPYARWNILVDDAGKCYHSGGNGFYFSGMAENDVENYVIDKLFMSQSGFTVIWDEEHRKFMSYDLGPNWCYDQTNSEHDSYPQQMVAGNMSMMSDFPVAALEEDGHQMEILWLGQGITPNSTEMGATAIGVMADTMYYALYIEASDKEGKSTRGGDDSPIKVKRVFLGTDLNFDEHTCFATSSAYPEQFFYTWESKLYLFNTVNKESVELYDAGGLISQLKFRLVSEHSLPDGSQPWRCLGMIVNKSGAGELHEVVLDEAGDFSTSHVFTGFGEIKDMIFTHVQRKFL